MQFMHELVFILNVYFKIGQSGARGYRCIAGNVRHNCERMFIL